jgi:hypothetical protein
VNTNLEHLSIERLVTLGEAAKTLGVPLFALRRASRNGDFPIYQIGNGRARVRISEIIAAIEASKKDRAK